MESNSIKKSEESKEVSNSGNNLQLNEDLTEFNPDRWVRQLTSLASKPDQLEVETFVGMLHETTNLFKKMGSALSIAFSGNTLIILLFS